MTKKILEKLRNEFLTITKSEFTKNVLTIFSGVSFAQIIPFFVSPILTRIYKPIDFALVGLFTSTALFFGNIATLQYDKAIMLPRENDDAINLVALSFLAVTFMTIMSLLIVVLLNKPLISLMDNKNMRLWLYLIPVSVFLHGTFRTLSMWASRQKKFKRLALCNVGQVSTTATAKLLLGFLKHTKGGLIVGSLTGQTLANVLLGFQTKNDQVDYKKISLKRLKKNAVKYKNFPLFSNWQNFTNMINSTGTKYIISNIFGATILGWFSFTFGILNRPLQIIGQSISQVFYQNISDRYNQGRSLWPFIKKMILRLVFIGIIIFVPVLLFGPVLFRFVFGKNWEEAGVYAQLMVPWLFAQFIISPIASLHLVLNKQKQFFLMSLMINFLVPAIFIVAGKIFMSFRIVLFLSSLFIFAYSIFVLFWFRKIILSKNNT